MVNYSTWTGIGYEVARAKGADLTGSGTQENNRRLVSLLAEIWQERKDEIAEATRTEARRIAERELNVS